MNIHTIHTIFMYVYHKLHVITSSELWATIFIIVRTNSNPIYRIVTPQHHSLHNHISRVLTANGLINGKAPFSTLTESTSLNQSPQSFARLIMSTTSTAMQNLEEICPWWLLCWNITIFKKYLYLFSRNTLTGQITCQIFTLDGSHDVDSHKDVPFWL